MIHSLLVTRPVKRYIEPRRKLYSLFEKDKLTGRWHRVAANSYYQNTARFVFSERILSAMHAGKYQDIRAIE